jgi:hypothetical protein
MRKADDKSTDVPVDDPRPIVAYQRVGAMSPSTFLLKLGLTFVLLGLLTAVAVGVTVDIDLAVRPVGFFWGVAFLLIVVGGI